MNPLETGRPLRFCGPKERITATVVNAGPLARVATSLGERALGPLVRALAAPSGLPSGAIIALFVGDPRKGFDVALEAVRQVPGVRLAAVSRPAQHPVMERAGRAGIAELIRHGEAGGLVEGD